MAKHYVTGNVHKSGGLFIVIYHDLSYKRAPMLRYLLHVDVADIMPYENNSLKIVLIIIKSQNEQKNEGRKKRNKDIRGCYYCSFFFFTRILYSNLDNKKIEFLVIRLHQCSRQFKIYFGISLNPEIES